MKNLNPKRCVLKNGKNLTCLKHEIHRRSCWEWSLRRRLKSHQERSGYHAKDSGCDATVYWLAFLLLYWWWNITIQVFSSSSSSKVKEKGIEREGCERQKTGERSFQHSRKKMTEIWHVVLLEDVKRRQQMCYTVKWTMTERAFVGLPAVPELPSHFFLLDRTLAPRDAKTLGTQRLGKAEILGHHWGTLWWKLPFYSGSWLMCNKQS